MAFSEPMSSIFGDEHELFRKSVRAWIENEVIPHVDGWEEAGQIPRAVFRRMGELGFLGVQLPADYGGGGADFAMSVVLAEELARGRSGGFAFSVVVHTDMSSPWLVRFGTEAQKRRWLPAIARGETVCALAITEPGDYWVISGSKIFITNGVHGDLYFVAARTRDHGPQHQQLSQFVVERGTAGFTVSRALAKTGMWASDTAALSFAEVRVPAGNLLGEEGARLLSTGGRATARAPHGGRALRGRLPARPRGLPGVHAPPRGLRSAARRASGLAPSPGRHGDPDRGGAPAHLPRGGLLHGR
jgi:alkylation response protein AidB-like acyl-CoA dehydrogenase